jgi:hypothetical protein
VRYTGDAGEENPSHDRPKNPALEAGKPIQQDKTSNRVLVGVPSAQRTG